MKQRLLAAAIVASGLCATATVAVATDTASLDPVLVTADRVAVPLDESLAPALIITRQDIDRLQPLSVQDLLVGLPGVAVANSGGLGQQTSVFVRGTNSDHVVVLIDGVRMASVSTGIPAWAQIPVDQIDHIEFVRGPRSSLYGADAIGGVIQIFTRHGQTGQGLSPSFSLTGGSHNYGDFQAGLSGGSSHAWFNAGLGTQYTSGIQGCRIGAAEMQAGCFVDQAGNDMYRAYNASLSGGYRWDSGAVLTVNWLRDKDAVQFAGDFGNYMRRGEQVAGAQLSLPVLSDWSMQFTAGQNRDDATTYQGPAYVGQIQSQRDQFSWQNDIRFNQHQLLSIGTDYEYQFIGGDTGYTRDSRGDTGVFAMYRGEFGANTVQLSGRHDDNQQFGGVNTGSAAWAYHFAHGLSLEASYGSAFHAPTFNDLYYPAFEGIPSANPNLKPERSRNAELDLSQNLAHGRWMVSAYQNLFTDLIGYGPNFLPENISRARIRGVEGQYQLNWSGWILKAYASWMQPYNRSPGSYDALLPRRPSRTARIDLDRQLGKFSVGGSLYASGHSFDDAANLDRLGGYSTIDLRGSWNFQPSWQLQLRLANLADKRYATAWYYNTLGRTAYLTVRYSPGGGSTP